MDADTPITDLLAEWGAGDEEALKAVLELTYSELRAAAGRAMAGERSTHTLQPTALVNEVYLRLLKLKNFSLENRGAFLAFAARSMRRILVDHARAAKAEKRGGKVVHVSLESADLPAAPSKSLDILALDHALTQIEEKDERLGKIIELRFFAGLSEVETAKALGIGRATVQREWAIGKRLLAELLKDKI